MNGDISQQILEIVNLLDKNIQESVTRTKSLEVELERKITNEYEKQLSQYEETKSDEDLLNFLNIKRTKYLLEINKTTFKELASINIVEILNEVD